MRARKAKNQMVERTMRTLDEILAPLRELNKKTVVKVLPKVMSNIKQYLIYLNDISKPHRGHIMERSKSEYIS